MGMVLLFSPLGWNPLLVALVALVFTPATLWTLLMHRRPTPRLARLGWWIAGTLGVGAALAPVVGCLLVGPQALAVDVFRVVGPWLR
jgi:hypothetical protein